MNTTELLAAFRDEMADNAAPYLWSDSAVYRYLDDAQKMFCRLTEGIEDSSTADICRLSVVAGTDWYALSPKILKVREVIDLVTGRPYGLISAEKAPSAGAHFTGQPGPLRLFVQGLEKGKLRAWPMPASAVSVELRVFRMPLVTLSGANQTLEIDEQHHLALLDWVKRHAYNKEDAETFNRRKAEEYEGRFRAYCAAARVEQERARRTTGTVIYGGI